MPYLHPHIGGLFNLRAQLSPSDMARGMAQSIEESFMKITEPRHKLSAEWHRGPAKW